MEFLNWLANTNVGRLLLLAIIILVGMNLVFNFIVRLGRGKKK